MMRHVTPDLLRASPLPQPVEGAGKDERGRVLVIAGSRSVPGAAWLSGIATLRSGAGKLHIATIRSMVPHLAMAVPEARVTGLDETEGGEIAPAAADRLAGFAQAADAVLVGPGMLDDAATRGLVHALLDATSQPPFVLDAAAITALGGDAQRLRAHAGRLLVTPHAGEMASLLGLERAQVEADPAVAVARAVAVTGGIVALKGRRTLIAEPGPTGAPPVLWACERGNVGLATSGSGDVLAGIVTGLLARGADPLRAMQWGVFLHGEAGTRLARRIGPLGYLARELLDEIPPLLASLPET